MTIGEVCTRLLTVTREDPIFLTLRRMATIDVGRLPEVVAAHDHRQLVGPIRSVAWPRHTLLTSVHRAR